MTFQGTNRHSIDAKNRLFMPAKFREELGTSFTVAPSPDGCLFVYTNEIWDLKTEEIMARSKTREDRIRQRRTFSNVITAEPDKQGRITLSPELMAFAGLEHDVLIVGAGSRIEIWDVDRYNAMMEPDEDMSAEELFPLINY